MLCSNPFCLAYELLSNGENKPCRFKTSSSISQWNASDEGTEIKAAGKRELHTSPVCLWIPEGGKNGTLIVGAQYENKGHHELFVSYDYGKTYSLIANPFTYSDKPGFGYSPSMFYSEAEKTIYCANTVDYRDELSKISFAGLKIAK